MNTSQDKLSSTWYGLVSAEQQLSQVEHPHDIGARVAP